MRRGWSITPITSGSSSGPVRTCCARSASIKRATLEAGEGVYAVAEVAIRYRSPARLDDALLILSELRELRAASCVIHQRVMRQTSNCR